MIKQLPFTMIKEDAMNNEKLYKLIDSLDYVIATCEDPDNPPTANDKYDKWMARIFFKTLTVEQAEMVATELLTLVEHMMDD
jgi:hypothetical protein